MEKKITKDSKLFYGCCFTAIAVTSMVAGINTVLNEILTAACLGFGSYLIVKSFYEPED